MWSSFKWFSEDTKYSNIYSEVFTSETLREIFDEILYGSVDKMLQPKTSESTVKIPEWMQRKI